MGSPSSLERPSGRQVEAADFTGNPAGIPATRPIETSVIPTRVVSVEQAQGGEVVGESDPEAASRPTRVVRTNAANYSIGESVLVDAKVGDLNGEPIFANEWLTPLSGRLSAASAELELEEWRLFAGNLIRDRLAGELKDQLLYAEIQSELSAAEKAGLSQVIRNARREQVRRSGGSETVAGRRLQDANDQTLDSFLRDRERQILVAEKYRREIDDKVQVSQRDIKLFYERNRDEFNPPPIATIYRIRVSTSKSDAIAEIKRRLAAGEAFEEAATIEANSMGEISSERSIVGPYEEFEFYSVEPLDAAAKSLAVGRVAGPIEHGSSTSWLYLSKLEDRSVSLYDAQLLIENQLKTSQRRELEQRYIFRLIRRAGLAEFDEIVANLTQIAERWYYAGPVEGGSASTEG